MEFIFRSYIGKLTHNTIPEKGLTYPTAKGNAAELSDPISFDVNIALVGDLKNSCPAK